MEYICLYFNHTLLFSSSVRCNNVVHAIELIVKKQILLAYDKIVLLLLVGSVI